MAKRHLRRESSSGFRDVKVPGGKDPKPDEIIEIFKLGKEYTHHRFVGSIVRYPVWWITIPVAKARKDGSTVVDVPRLPPNWDVEKGEYDPEKTDPYKDLPNDKRLDNNYYMNSIVRELQEDEPRRKPPPTEEEERTGYKTKGSRTWTPVRGNRLPSSVILEIQNLSSQNRHRVKSRSGGQVTKAFDLNHTRFGRDVMISYDSAAPPVSKYSVSLDEKSRLTEDELDYFIWDLYHLWTAKEDPEEDAAELARLWTDGPSTGEKDGSGGRQRGGSRAEADDEGLQEEDLPWDYDGDEDGETLDLEDDDADDLGRGTPRRKPKPKRKRPSGGKESARDRVRRRLEEKRGKASSDGVNGKGASGRSRRRKRRLRSE